MILLVKSGGEKAVPEWRACFAELAPQLDVRWWDDPSVDPAAVRYVLVWDPEPGRLAKLPNLKLILGSAAGIDPILRDPELPRHLPIVRMGGAMVAQRMADYVAWAALTLLREGRRIAIAQAERRWDFFDPPAGSDEKRAGILGLGNLGTRAAEVLRDIGFRTAGWSRTRKSIPGVESYAGDAELPAFLARTDILVCLLPATEQTRGILSWPLFRQLPRGAGLVNAARGVQQDLGHILEALDEGQLSGAVLDVFEPEPLPAEHPAWTHPKVTITAHIASAATRFERARHVARAIAAFEAGEKLPNLYDPVRGY